MPSSDADRPLPTRTLQRVRRTVMVVDVVESVRLLLSHEEEVIGRWCELTRTACAELLPPHGGRLVKSLGDGMLIDFGHPYQALATAFALHALCARGNEGKPPEAAIVLRIGVHVADVIVTALDVFGAGVNLTARLAALGRPGDVVVSAEVRDELVPGVDAVLEDLGECFLKHIDQPCRAWRANPPTGLPASARAAAPQRPASAPVLPVPRPVRPLLLVLPLQPAPGAELPPGLAAVLTDDIVAALGRSREIQVVSRLSVQVLHRRPLDTGPLRQSMQFDHGATGLLALRRGRLLLQIELDEAGTPIWSGHFEAALDALMAPGDELSLRVADALCHAIVRRQVQRLHRSALPNLPGYALLLTAMDLLHRLSRDDVMRAQSLFDHLAERHPRSPEVQAWFAKWHFLQVAQSFSDDRVRSMQAARQCLGRALDTEPDNGLALAIRGHLLAFEDRDPAAAMASLTEATERAANEPLAWLFRANLKAMLGDATAGDDLQRGTVLSPLDPMGYLRELMASIVHSAAGRTAQALACAEASVRQNALHLSSLVQLIVAQMEAGQPDAARATAQRYLALRPGASVQRFIDHHLAAHTPLAQRQAQALLAAEIPL